MIAIVKYKYQKNYYPLRLNNVSLETWSGGEFEAGLSAWSLRESDPLRSREYSFYDYKYTVYKSYRKCKR